MTASVMQVIRYNSKIMTEQAYYRIEGGSSIGNWFVGIKSYGLDAVPSEMCVYPHLETDRKSSVKDTLHAFSFVEPDETRTTRWWEFLN